MRRQAGGVMLLGPIEDAPTQEWDRMIELNLKGLLDVAHAALPHLLDTELPGHNRPEIQELLLGRIGDIERLESEDVADAIAYIVTRPRRTSINELLIRPTEQER